MGLARPNRQVESPRLRLGGHLIYRNNLLSSPDVKRKGMTTARVRARARPMSVESRWSPNATFPGFGVQLASKFSGTKPFTFSKCYLKVVDISCLGCKRSCVQIPDTRGYEHVSVPLAIRQGDVPSLRFARLGADGGNHVPLISCSAETAR
jgi:hypothetical protein